jgi:hypothetical protein
MNQIHIVTLYFFRIDVVVVHIVIVVAAAVIINVVVVCHWHLISARK